MTSTSDNYVVGGMSQESYKLRLLHELLQGHEYVVVDPKGEYKNICDNFGIKNVKNEQKN